MQKIVQQKNNNQQKVQNQQILIQKQFKRKWLSIGYGSHNLNQFQYIYRSTTKQVLSHQNNKKNIDGIQVIPIIQYPNHKEIVFIANFRPSVGKFILQFPAGLMQGEDPYQNLKRQLEEQTGLVAYKFVDMPNPQMYSDPHKGNQSGLFFIGLIDGTNPNSFIPSKRQQTENIRCYSFKYSKQIKMTEMIYKFAQLNQYVFDVKIWQVCLTLDLIQRLKEQNINIFGS